MVRKGVRIGPRRVRAPFRGLEIGKRGGGMNNKENTGLRRLFGIKLKKGP